MNPDIGPVYESWLYTDKAAFPNAKSAQSRTDKIRRVFNCGYFVLLFGQLEQGIDYAFEAMIGCPASIFFMDRVRLLDLDAEQFDQIADDYAIRCEIAHGKNLEADLDISEVAERYKPLIESLTA